MTRPFAVIVALLALLALVPSSAKAESAGPSRLGVTVTYAIVPKDQLTDAVKGDTQASEIEAAWRNALAASSNPMQVLYRTKYSVVVFVHNTATQAIWGRLGFPIQNPNRPTFILNVNLSPGYDGTYVIDGGGLVLPGFPESKPYSWLEFHFE